MLKRIIVIVLLVVCVTGLLIYSKIRHEPFLVSGFIESDEIRIGSRVGGRVEKVLTEEGAPVKKDQVLIKLEPYDLIYQEKEAKAVLTSRQAEVDKLKAGLRPEEVAQTKSQFDQLAAHLEMLKNGPRKEEINAAKGREEASEAQLSLANQNYKRLSALFKSKSISRQEFEQVEQLHKSAQADYIVKENELKLLISGTRKEEIQEAEANLEKAKAAWMLAKSGYRKEDIIKAEAARDSAEASLAAIQERLKELTIRSPVDGAVEALELQSGDLIGPGTPILSIMDTSKKWIRSYIPENKMNLKIGQKLKLTIDSFPNREFYGKLSFISRQAEFTPSNLQTAEERSKQVFRIKVHLVDEKDELKPGMAADVWLDQVIEESIEK